jgi:hypothetical protein
LLDESISTSEGGTEPFINFLFRLLLAPAHVKGLLAAFMIVFFCSCALHYRSCEHLIFSNDVFNDKNTVLGESANSLNKMRTEMESTQAGRVLCAMASGRHELARTFVIAQLKSHFLHSLEETNVETRMKLTQALSKLLQKIVSKPSFSADDFVSKSIVVMLHEKIPALLVEALKGIDYDHPEATAAINNILVPLEILSKCASGAHLVSKAVKPTKVSTAITKFRVLHTFQQESSIAKAEETVASSSSAVDDSTLSAPDEQITGL